MRNELRNIAAIVAALTLMQVASGALAVAIPLALDGQGVGPFAIGVTTAFFGGGLMLGATTAPGLIAQIGHIRAFAFFAAIASTLALALFLRVDPFSWSVVRFGIGACAAGLYTAGESWIASETSEQKRGALIGVYHVLTKIALVVGAVAVGRMSIGGPAPYMFAGAMFALCLAPVAATRRAAPSPPSPEPLHPGRLFAMAPAAVYAVAVAGFVNGAVLGLSPIYAAQSASDPAAQAVAAAAFYGALTIGGVVSQFPAGALSDHIDRRVVVGGLAAIAAAASIGLALTPRDAPEALSLTLALLWGAGALSFYGVGVAHAVDRAPTALHAPVIGGLLLIWAAGNVVGPPVAGLVMQAGLGGAGLFVYAALALAVLAFLMFRRSTSRDATPSEQREPFATVVASSLAAAELDPRTDGSEAAESEDVELEEEEEEPAAPVAEDDAPNGDPADATADESEAEPDEGSGESPDEDEEGEPPDPR